MRGLRRFCVGMAVLMFSWTTPAAWAQSPQPTPIYGNGGLAWPPAGMVDPLGQSAPSAGHGWPMPLMNGTGGEIQQTQYQQAQFQQAPPMAAPAYGPGNQLNPYPGLDMYRYGWQQTINENGLWFSERRNARRNYVFGVEFLIPVYRQPGDQMFGYGGIDTGIGATDDVPAFYFSVPRDPGTLGGGTGGGGNNNNNASIVTETELQRYFPTRNFGSMFDDNSSTGIRLNLGFEDENGAGMSVNAWYGGESTQTFRRGAESIRNYTPTLDPFTLVGNDPLYILELSALNGSLPIDNGTGVAERIPFDTMFEMKFSQEAWGAGLRITRPAISRSSWYELRPVIGVRYINIREGFAFRGIDSGAEYEIINFNDIDYAQEFETLFNLDQSFATVGNNNVGEAGFEGRPDASTFNDDALVLNGSNVYPLVLFPTNPYETQVSASNQAHTAGPEFGLQADLGGGRNFKVKIHGIAGVAATQERLQLDGFGVYNHFVNRVDPDNNALTPDGGEIGTGLGALTDAQTTFRDSTSTTHVSPTLDLGVSAEMRLFSYIPVLREMSILEDAKFRTSYEFLYVGNLARPQESENYISSPVNPTLDPNRSGWTMTQWSFGIDWNY